MAIVAECLWYLEGFCCYCNVVIGIRPGGIFVRYVPDFVLLQVASEVVGRIHKFIN